MTQLSTIAEQNSYAISNSVPPDWIFQSPTTSRLHPMSTTTLKIDGSGGVENLRHWRQCVSLDDHAIRKLHQMAEERQIASDDFSRSSEQSPQRGVLSVPEPVKAPFPPPERVKTPEGVLSWRGQQATGLLDRYRIPNSSSRLFIRQLRQRSSRVFSHIFGIPYHSAQTRERMWRPPVSGHTTLRYADVSLHPFTISPSAGVEHDQSSSDGLNYPCDQQECGQTLGAHARRPVDRSVLPRTANTYDNGKFDQLGTPSQRALQAITGNAIVVSPGRARAWAESSLVPRSVSLPQSQLRPTTTSPEARTLPSSANASLRTTDLIEQFPTPPNFNNHDGTANEEANNPCSEGRPSSNVMRRASGELTSRNVNRNSQGDRRACFSQIETADCRLSCETGEQLESAHLRNRFGDGQC